MKKNSYFKIGSGSRKGFVSKFQDNELKETINQNQVSTLRNQIITKSSENMNELISNCVSLTVTSPPYNIGKDSDEDLSDDEY